MSHNRFSKNENDAVEVHLPRHWDFKTKKPQHQDPRTKKLWHWDFKAFFQETKNHNIGLGISVLWFFILGISMWWFFSLGISKTEIQRHQDSKTKKPRYRVSAEFRSLCPLIICSGNILWGFVVAICLENLL